MIQWRLSPAYLPWSELMRVFIALLLCLVVPMAAADPIESVDTTRGVVVGGRAGRLFATGGIGSDQQEALGKIAPDCNLRLTFSQEKSGEYLADVGVKILDSDAREVFDVGNAGPLFYTRLAPGQYTIFVQWHGKEQIRDVRIGRSGAADVHFYWPREG